MPRTSGADPFTRGSSAGPREGVKTYRVRIEVACDQCLIQYWLGPQRVSVTPGPADQIWSRRVSRYPLQREAIGVRASTGLEGGEVVFVKIYVDGDVVAEAYAERGDIRGAETVPRTLSTETTIGPT